MDQEQRKWLEEFVWRCAETQAAVNRLLEVEAMGDRYHPTGDARADGIRAKVDELVGYVKGETAASGPEAQRAAALAVTNLQQGGMWAVKALQAEDAVRGDEAVDP
jgi:hypothetical protein